MAIRVSGVSLRVEGAEEFASKLEQANSAMRKNSAEMKLLEATYAGAKSSDYYAQRSQLLGKQLDEQRKKTETLRQARDAYAKSADVDSKKLEQLDLKIIQSQTDEAKLANEIKTCNQAMGDQAQQAGQAAAQTQNLSGQAQTAATAQGKLADEAGKAGKGMQDAKADAQSYGEKLDQLADKAGKVGSTLTRVLTLPIIGMGTAGLKYSMDFEDAMWEVATMPGFVSGTLEQQQQQLDAMGDLLLQVSNRTNTAATDLAAAQYQALSSGVSKEDSTYWVERAAMTAKAGQTDVKTVIDGASSVQNAWKETAGGLDHILNAMITTQNKGKTTVGQIAAQIGQVAGLAPQLGVSFDETMAAVAALTANGVTTSSAITGLKGVMSAVIKPTSDATKLAKELGLEFNAVALNAKGFTGFLADVMEKTGGDSAKLSRLFGQVEGLNSVMMLGTSAASLYNQTLAEIGKSDGALEEAFELRTSSRSEKLSAAINKAENAGIELTESLYPAVDMVSEWLGGLAEYMGSLDEGQQRAAVGTLALAAAIGPALTATSKLIQAGRTLAAVFSGPYGWAALGVAAIGGGLVYAIHAAGQEMRDLEQKSLEFDIGLNDASVKASVSNIQAQLTEWTSTHQLTASGRIVPIVDSAKLNKDLQDAVDAAFKDRKVTTDEYVNIHTQLVTVENEAHEGEKSVDPAIRTVATELQGAVDDYNRLLETVYRKGNTATDAEIAALNTALERVKTLRAELTGLREATEDTETQEYRTAYQMARQGVGGQKAVEGATVYVVGQGILQAQADAEARQALVDEQYKEIAEATEAGQSTEELQAIEAAHQQALAELDAIIEGHEEDTRQSYMDFASDLVKAYPDVTEWAQEGGEILKNLNGVSQMFDAYDARDEQRMAALLNKFATPEVLGKYMGGLYLDSQGTYAKDFTGNWADVSFDDLYNVFDFLEQGFQEALNQWMDKPIPQENLDKVGAAWQTMLENGLDPSAIDLSKVDGALADYLRVSMFDKDGMQSIGTEAMSEIGSGITEGSAEATDAATDAAESVDDALKPVGEQTDKGSSAGNTIAAGIVGAAPAAVTAARNLAASVNAQLAQIGNVNITLPGMGLTFGSMGGRVTAGGGIVNNYNTNVTMPNARLGGAGNVSALAARINALNRQTQLAYGNA